jgi:hypothetical protein
MSKNIAIMQPYFLPYIGYFQLINSVDEFVIYDNIQYTKKGWINRNRILSNGNNKLISLTLKADSDFLNIVDRRLSNNWKQDRIKLINQIKGAYKKAHFFESVFPLIEKIIMNNEDNLFQFIYDSLILINDFLDIKTKFIISSTIDIDHVNLKSKDKVIAICKNLDAKTYINAIGGIDLYDKNEFENNAIKLNFIKTNPIKYKQFNNEFVPWLSIIDVMMFNSTDEIKNYLKQYTLI